MRKTAFATTVIMLSFIASFSVCAESSKDIEISMSAENAVAGRLFDVSVRSDDADNIAGGEFTLCYDSNVVDFRKASSDSFEVKAETYEDAVKIVFVVDDSEISDDSLFDLEFKAKSKTDTQIELVSSYVVDRGLDTVSVSGSCDVAVDKNKSQKAEINKDDFKTLTSTGDTATADNQSVRIDGSDNRGFSKYIIALAVIVATVGANVWFMIGKRKSK